VPFLLRKITKSKWYRGTPHPWIGENEIEADALNDLKTQANALSVWLIDDKKSNLGRIIVAMVANGNHFDNFDYVLLPLFSLQDLGIKIIQNNGVSPDTEANQIWHRDLIELTTEKLCELARAFRFQGEFGQKREKEILNLLIHENASQHLDRSKIKIETPSSFWDRLDQV
jgi:hypothetical protein